MYQVLAAYLETDSTKFIDLFLTCINAIDINTPTYSDKSTFLHQAALRGNVEIVGFLLSRNANVNVYNKHNDTPLAIAVRGQKYEVVKLLLTSEIILINTYNIFGFAPIHYAATHSNSEILGLLIPRANLELPVNLSDSRATPLLLAVSKGLTANVQLLLEKGADVNATNAKKLSSIYFAMEQKSSNCLSKLLFWGSDLPEDAAQNHKSLVENYKKIREENSPIKTIIKINKNVYENDSFPSLKQIVAFMMQQSGYTFSNKKLTSDLMSYIHTAFPRKLSAGIASKVPNFEKFQPQDDNTPGEKSSKRL